MPFVFHPVNESDVRAFSNWRYEAPYDIYTIDSSDEEDIQFFLDPRNAYYSIRDRNERIGFCCFGPDARVPGGDYSAEALDVGIGIRPDLTGQGRGVLYMTAVLDFASRRFTPKRFRVTVAEFNKRALRVCEKVGFRPVQRFQKSRDGSTFVVLIREIRTPKKNRRTVTP